MFCKYCGEPIKEGRAFCGSCGNKIAPEKSAEQPDKSVPVDIDVTTDTDAATVNDCERQTEHRRDVNRHQPSAKSKSKAISIAVAAVLLACIAAGGYFIWQKSISEEPEMAAKPAPDYNEPVTYYKPAKIDETKEAGIAAQKAKADEEARRAAQKARADEEARLAAQKAKADEETRIAAQRAKAAEEARLAAQKAKVDEETRIAAQRAKAAEDARLAAQKAKAEEEARIAAQQAKAAEDARLAAQQAKAAEDARLAAKAKADEEARKLENARRTFTVAAGTPINVSTSKEISTKTGKTGDEFIASLNEDIVVGGRVVARRGAAVKGVISESDPGGRVKGVAMISLKLTSLVLADGSEVSITTNEHQEEAKPSVGKDAAKTGIGAGIGAAIGAIVGGGKGAAIGGAIGGAGGAATVLATHGDPAVIASETPITFNLTAPLTGTLNK